MAAETDITSGHFDVGALGVVIAMITLVVLPGMEKRILSDWYSTLTVTLDVKDGMAVMTFTDTGCGMTSEVLENLFEPFFTHGKSHGTGLGLSICKRIVEDHKGWIAASNRRGGGVL